MTPYIGMQVLIKEALDSGSTIMKERNKDEPQQ